MPHGAARRSASSAAHATPAWGAVYILVLLGALLWGAQVAAGAVDVSQLKAIVLGAEPDKHEEQAARELARYLERMFEVKLPVEVRKEIGPATAGA